MGSGTNDYRRKNDEKEFQSTHSVGSGTSAKKFILDALQISIHPLRGEWDGEALFINTKTGISIHPLRGEWDL